MTVTFDRVRAILAKDFQIAAEAVTPQAQLESLGLDSLGVAELLFNVQDAFDITLPPEPAELCTVGDVAGYIDALIATRKPVVTAFSAGSQSPTAPSC